MYLIRNNNLIEIKGDRFSVGHDETIENRTFKNQLIKLHENDAIYLFSDGFADQFGGKLGKKFKYRRFRHLLLTIHDKNFSIQKDILEDTINAWKSEYEQVDDILLIGFKVPASQKSKLPKKENIVKYEYKIKIKLIDI